MKLKILFFLLFLALIPELKSQNTSNNSLEIGVGVISQQTLKLYCENGVGVDLAADFLLEKRLHVKLSYITSRFGSALGSNAIKQDYYLMGLDWRFRAQSDFQIFAGLSTGYFMADYEVNIFNGLPSSSLILAPEVGLVYKFKFPVSLGLSGGYNLISGNGISVPGTLFPLYGRLSVLYDLGNLFNK